MGAKAGLFESTTEVYRCLAYFEGIYWVLVNQYAIQSYYSKLLVL